MPPTPPNRPVAAPQAHGDHVVDIDRKPAVDVGGLRQVGDVAALEPTQLDAAGERRQLSDDALEQRRLAGAVRTDDRDQGAVRDRAVQMMHGRMPIIAERQIFEPQLCVHGLIAHQSAPHSSKAATAAIATRSSADMRSSDGEMRACRMRATVMVVMVCHGSCVGCNVILSHFAPATTPHVTRHRRWLALVRRSIDMCPMPAMSRRSPVAHIRRARVRHLDELIELETMVFDSDRMSRRSLRHFLVAPSATVLVAEHKDRIAGCAVILFRPNSRIARLYSIAVAPHSAGRGIGPALLAASERAALAKRRKIMRLEVHERNRRAIARYRKAGYQQFGHYTKYYADKADALRFEKQLSTR